MFWVPSWVLLGHVLKANFFLDLCVSMNRILIFLPCQSDRWNHPKIFGNQTTKLFGVVFLSLSIATDFQNGAQFFSKMAAKDPEKCSYFETLSS